MTDRSGAYTLLEVLVSLSIIGIIFVVGYVNFRGFAQRQALLAAARNTRSDLRLAQQQSLAGQKPSGCETLLAYSFTVTNPSSYEIKAVCNNATYLIREKELPEETIFEPFPSPNPVLFKVLGQGTNITSGASANFALLQPATGNKTTVVVNWTGEIK